MPVLPPETSKLIQPVLVPLQFILKAPSIECDVVNELITSSVGSFKVKFGEGVRIQPFSSFIKQEYTPAVKAVISFVVAVNPEGPVQEYI